MPHPDCESERQGQERLPQYSGEGGFVAKVQREKGAKAHFARTGRQRSSKQLGGKRMMGDDQSCAQRQHDARDAEIPNLTDAGVQPAQERPENVELLLQGEGHDGRHGVEATGAA